MRVTGCLPHLGRAGWCRYTRDMSWRRTNVALFAALALAFATGAGAVATGSARGRWVILAHGVAAAAGGRPLPPGGPAWPAPGRPPPPPPPAAPPRPPPPP